MTTDVFDRTGELAAWANAIDALPLRTSFFAALSRSSVTNSGDLRATGRWLLLFFAKQTQPGTNDQETSPLNAFDDCIYDIEALVKIWAAFQMSLLAQPTGDSIDAEAQLAEFMVRRIPEVWKKRQIPQAPVTKAVALADRIDTLCGMFSAGLKPNGSNDPYALRRAANNILLAILPLTPAHFRHR